MSPEEQKAVQRIQTKMNMLADVATKLNAGEITAEFVRTKGTFIVKLPIEVKGNPVFHGKEQQFEVVEFSKADMVSASNGFMDSVAANLVEIERQQKCHEECFKQISMMDKVILEKAPQLADVQKKASSNIKVELPKQE